ncbi:aspartate--tRNA(Asn) ligase [Falsibacillus pallidus]|uniref:Aspartate--tRNA ligase n=1 Tax=Falsibacillus pallidus TaxID=493781 RepID=A0A370GU07_9BACI|nr:aspartate--tRNA(Asn) ligase [Falsibacillus pallidus]RDI45423.1 aspartyl-tRNA synthetase [Falsibacillus pallidus]
MEKGNRVLAFECGNYIGQTIILKGWVHRVRHLKSVSFIILKDRTGYIQCVLENQFAGMKIENESAIVIKGIAAATGQQQNGVEIIVEDISILSKSETLPFEVNKKELDANLDLILNHRLISMRNERTQAIFKIQSAITGAFQEFMRRNGFMQMFTPKLVAQGAEGGANVFKLDYFGKEAFLAQSPQLYKQMMVAAGYERVYEIAPVFRAEQHNSSRHLNEYTSLDAEMGFIEGFEEIMEMENEALVHIFQYLKETCGNELAALECEVPDLGEFPRITLEQAHEILQESFGKSSPEGDLDGEGELLICKYVQETYESPFVFITHYPVETRPMYTMPDLEQPGKTKSFDLLFRGTEITSGGQRIHEYELLEKSLEEKGLNPLEFESYLNTFKYGAPPHGGFAIGLERLTAKLLGLNNVREASAFPRDCDRLVP